MILMCDVFAILFWAMQKCICHADSPSFDGNYESYTLTSGAAMRWNENIKFRMPATAFSEKENMHIRFEIRTICKYSPAGF